MAALLFVFRYFSCMFLGEQVSADVSAISTLQFHTFLTSSFCSPGNCVLPGSGGDPFLLVLRS